jgi:hypothetical protein
MIKMKPAKGLYFTATNTPTAAELEEAKALSITAFRNVELVSETGLEPAEIVAGKVPEGYRKITGQRIATSQIYPFKKEK